MKGKNRKYRPEHFNFSSLETEKIPIFSPEEKIQLKDEITREQRKSVLEQIRVVPYIGRDLLEFSWRLVELSHRYEGNFLEGKDVSITCRALSTGAITVACAAFEAYLNEEIFNASSFLEEHGSIGKVRLLELSINLPPRDRVDALFAAYEQPIGWGSEPFQSLDLVLSIRKHLLHHEVKLYNAFDGHWPARKLKDLKRRIGSPYSNDLILDWNQHALTPAGAEWAVRVICDIIGRMDELWDKRQSKLKEDSGNDMAAPED